MCVLIRAEPSKTILYQHFADIDLSSLTTKACSGLIRMRNCKDV